MHNFIHSCETKLCRLTFHANYISALLFEDSYGINLYILVNVKF